MSHAYMEGVLEKVSSEECSTRAERGREVMSVFFESSSRLWREE